MNQHVLHHLSKIAESHHVYAEDFADVLMSKYTSIGLMAIATVLAIKQYIFKPIQCWVPAEWPRPWEEYTENYCWIQNTYHVAFQEPGHPGLHARRESEISYFQWVPILLSIQALLVFLPHAFWRVASAYSGCDPHRIVKLAKELEEMTSHKKRHKLIHYVSSQLSKSIAMRTASQEPHKESRRPSCSRLSQSCGGFLFITYLVSKVAYLLCGLGHLFLMKAYLGFDELHFGWSCAAAILQGRQWQQTRIFPRVTFCDVPIKHVGQWNTRSVQCVLPMNMLNEKIYIFLWFWIVFSMALTIVYSIYWIGSVVPPAQRLKYVTSLLRIAHPPTSVGLVGRSLATERLRQSDAKLRFLRIDGVFILQMVAAKCGEPSAAHILDAMHDQRRAVSESSLEPTITEDAFDDRDETLPVRGLERSLNANVLPENQPKGLNGHAFGPMSSV